MKKKNYFQFLFTSILILANANGFAQGVGNHITMGLENCVQIAPNVVQLDLFIVSDGDVSSDLSLNALQYGINFNESILRQYDSIKVSYLQGTNDFGIPPLNNWNFLAPTGRDNVRIIQSALISNPGITHMVIGHKYRVGTFLLTSTSKYLANSNPNFSLQNTVVKGKTTTAGVFWIGTAKSTTAFSIAGTGNGCRSLNIGASPTLNPCSSCPPSANFKSDKTTFCTGSGCANFTDLSPDGPTSWQWSFPGANPASSTQQNPTNICYSSPGTYAVTLVASNSFGSDTLTYGKAILISYGPPVPTLSVVGGDTLVCSRASSYQWIYNLYPKATTTDSFYVATLSGNYNVVVSDEIGCTAMGNQISVTVPGTCSHIYCVMHFTNASCSTCPDGTAQIYGGGGASPYSYTWNTSPVQTTQIISGLLPRTYFACVTDANNCSTCNFVTIGYGNCSAYFSMYPDTIPHSYVIVNNATGVPPIKYLWNWGDGKTDTISYPSHTYDSAGTYNICLTITDSTGCTDNNCYSYNLQKPTNNTMVGVIVIPSLTTGTNNIQFTTYNLQLFPNPFSVSAAIVFADDLKDASLTIYNIYGQKVKAIEHIEGNQIMIRRENLPSGIYIYDVTEKGTRIANGKLVIE